MTSLEYSNIYVEGLSTCVTLALAYVLLLKLLDLTAAVPKHQHFELLRS